MKLKIFDYFFIILALTSIVFSSIYAYSGNGLAESVVIEVSGETYVYTLNTDRTIEVQGPLGVTKVRISNLEVFVEDSPCKDKLCVLATPLRREGEWNACMPNKIFIRIPESLDQKLDSLSF